MTRLVVVLLAEWAAVALTGRLAGPRWTVLRTDPGAALEAPADQLVVLVVHLAAAGAAWWLLLGTVLDGVLLLALGRRGGRGAGRGLTPRWVHRVVRRAVGALLVVSVVAGPAGATGEGRQPTAIAQVVAPPVPILDHPLAPAMGGLPAGQPAVPSTAPPPVAVPPLAVPPAVQPPVAVPPAAQPSTTAPADAPAAGAPAASPATAPVGVHVVAPGENLWTIARQQLITQDGPAPSDRAVHAHWIRLLRANEGLLRSGDPNLIHPGEHLRLPADHQSTS